MLSFDNNIHICSLDFQIQLCDFSAVLSHYEIDLELLFKKSKLEQFLSK